MRERKIDQDQEWIEAHNPLLGRVGDLSPLDGDQMEKGQRIKQMPVGRVPDMSHPGTHSRKASLQPHRNHALCHALDGSGRVLLAVTEPRGGRRVRLPVGEGQQSEDDLMGDANGSYCIVRKRIKNVWRVCVCLLVCWDA